MMVFHYLDGDADLPFDAQYVSRRVQEISQEAADLWALINETAQEEAARN